MRIKLSPKARRNITRILPFGLIWFVTGSLFMLIESAATRNQNLSPDTAITLSLSVFIFAITAVTFVGFLVGALEMILLENLFSDKSFFVKISYKMGLYTLVLLIIIFLTYPIAASLESGRSVLDSEVWQKFFRFMVSVTFLSTLLQLAFQLFISFIYAGLSENLGHAVLYNFFTGKYHRPKEETRIFLFLDMKSSTTIAEQLGHIRYFELLKEYYCELSDAIINHSGEVYQYIGDEVVISWPHKAGLEENNCVACFFAMKADLSNRSSYYMQKYQVSPDFKGGLHFGNVTTGEIGALKKEIIFTGDVLNVTARIQGLCHEYRTDLLVSSDLIEQLDLKEGFDVKSLGETILKGRSEPMGLYSVMIRAKSLGLESKPLRMRLRTL